MAQLLENVFRVSPELLADMRQELELQGDYTIFNYNEQAPTVDDCLRSQARVDRPRTGRCAALKRRILRRLDREGYLGQREPTEWVVIHSRPGCAPQHLHTDYHLASCAELSDEQVPVACLAALEPNTRLRVGPGPDELIHIPVGSVLVFRGDFVHGGAAYEVDNVRLHCYLDAPAVKARRGNTTYLAEMAEMIDADTDADADVGI